MVNMQTVLEPICVSWPDGKRPDDIIRIPFSTRDKTQLRVATFIDTLASSHH